MVYTRGQWDDFDSWNTSGWTAEDVLPYLKKVSLVTRAYVCGSITSISHCLDDKLMVCCNYRRRHTMEQQPMSQPTVTADQFTYPKEPTRHLVLKSVSLKASQRLGSKRSSMFRVYILTTVLVHGIVTYRPKTAVARTLVTDTYILFFRAVTTPTSTCWLSPKFFACYSMTPSVPLALSSDQVPISRRQAKTTVLEPSQRRSLWLLLLAPLGRRFFSSVQELVIPQFLRTLTYLWLNLFQE